MLAGSDLSIRAFDVGQRIWAIFFPDDRLSQVMPFWSRAGVGISSRLAEKCLKHKKDLREISPDSADVYFRQSGPCIEIGDRIANLLGRATIGPPRHIVRPTDVYLYQTGMSAIYNVHRYFHRKPRRFPFFATAKTTVLFGTAFAATPYTLEFFSHSFRHFPKGTEYDLLFSFLAVSTTSTATLPGSNWPVRGTIWA